ncbi:hypothetical protein [Arenivirga flava]|uniref:Uncharacterized protein n=1 Tax=Arenivirga flava TaxID=1930060 RepID=A0AA37UG12_9MICO|nr:hypothetical protein [Arenivirga flava]GMA29649.1 hypothetical protein GCM10025874_29020 [Arenivirga flava]
MSELLPSLIGLGIAAGYAVMFSLAAAGRTKGARNRLDGLAQASWALFGLVVAHRVVVWTAVPNVLWMLPVAIAAAGAALLVLRWRGLPTLPESRGARVAAVAQVVVMTAVSAALIAV